MRYRNGANTRDAETHRDPTGVPHAVRFGHLDLRVPASFVMCVNSSKSFSHAGVSCSNALFQPNHASTPVHQVLPEDDEKLDDAFVDGTVGRVLGGPRVDEAPEDNAVAFDHL